MANYEYRLMANPHRMAPTEGMKTEELIVGLLNAVGPTIAKLPGALAVMEPGGWEVISHEMTQLEGHLILTFLCRRPLEGSQSLKKIRTQQRG